MIDICIPIVGDRIEHLVPLFFSSLFKKVDLTNAQIHVIDKELTPQIKEMIEQYKRKSPCKFFVHYLDKALTIEVGSDRRQVGCFSDDTALTYKWAMDNCGDNQWVFLPHFDIVFLGDIINQMYSYCNEDVGMVGEHNMGICAINRITYNQCPIKFTSINGFFVNKDKHSDYKVRHESDTRLTNKNIRIEGFDCFELFELNLQSLGWKFVEIKDYSLCYHFKSGSGYHGQELILNNQIRKAKQFNYLLNT